MEKKKGIGNLRGWERERKIRKWGFLEERLVWIYDAVFWFDLQNYWASVPVPTSWL